MKQVTMTVYVSGQNGGPNVGRAVLTYGGESKAVESASETRTAQRAYVDAFCLGLRQLKEPCTVVLETNSDALIARIRQAQEKPLDDVHRLIAGAVADGGHRVACRHVRRTERTDPRA